MSIPPASPLPREPRLLAPIHERQLHGSLRTEQDCVHCVRAFLRFHARRRPSARDGALLVWFLPR